MHGRPWLLALMAVAAAALPFPAPAQAQAQAQAPAHGDQVQIKDVEVPSLAVGDHPFVLNATVQNKGSASVTVYLGARLYTGNSSAPCEGSRFNQSISKFQEPVHLGPGETVRVDGATERWQQVIESSRLSSDGTYEACVWARLAQCPSGQPIEACFVDYFSSPLAVRLRNLAPRVSIAADPKEGTTQTTFALSANVSDAEGDPVSVVWDFGDGGGAEGSHATHRFAAAGLRTVRVIASDGYDEAQASAAVRVNEQPSGRGTPAPPVPLVIGVLAMAAAVRRIRGRGPASPGPR